MFTNSRRHQYVNLHPETSLVCQGIFQPVEEEEEEERQQQQQQQKQQQQRQQKYSCPLFSFQQFPH